MLFNRSSLLTFLITLYCLVSSHELFHAWLVAPYERFGWVILLLWCLPLFYWYLFTDKARNRVAPSSILLGVALFFSLIGTLGDLNTLNYVALAIALASSIPLNFLSLFWLLCAAAWMPAIGWLGSHYFPQAVLFFRLLPVCVASFFLIIKIRQISQSHDIA